MRYGFAIIMLSGAIMWASLHLGRKIEEVIDILEDIRREIKKHGK